jgi:bifunctional DNase/RNase
MDFNTINNHKSNSRWANMKTFRHVLYSKLMASPTTQLEIKAIVMHRRTHEPTVILQDTGGLHTVPVPVASAEAGALVIGFDESGPGVPLPHDIVVQLFSAHRFTPQNVMFRVDESGRLFSTLWYRFRRRVHSIAMQPGDALTIAIRLSVPILIPTEQLVHYSPPGIPDSLDVFSQDVLLLGHPFNG